MKKIYLMRHGETRLNSMGLNQGSWDSPLTDLGISQAMKAKEWFFKEGIKIDSAYSSYKERACHTLEIVTALKDGQYKKDRRLSEWDFGMFEGQQSRLNPLPLNPDRGTKSFGKAFVSYGGESDTDVSNRMDECILEILKKTPKNTLIVSHGGSIYLWLQRYIEQAIIQSHVPFENCSIFELEYENKKVSLNRVINPLQNET
ncbi:histidine phosphatase family protein [Lactococcus lactis]|uniref:histidine phosphatase family protein n=1 Tax=Lactococcus lactis TaxID=1358 RepID=UPI001CF4B2AB|nr:histidine phosphatase family protein [Lactococcus lactis]UCS89259.1 histidine phosphatase family protein [Lactococcus lactis]